MGKLKLTNSLAKTNYVKNLVQKGICEVKEIVDYADHKLSPQLISNIVDFLEKEISLGKFSTADLDKSGILKEILSGCFDINDTTDLVFIDNQVTFLLDNNLVKKNTIILKGLTVIKSLIGLVVGQPKS